MIRVPAFKDFCPLTSKRNKNIFDYILPIFTKKCPFISEGCFKFFISTPAQRSKNCPLSSERW